MLPPATAVYSWADQCSWSPQTNAVIPVTFRRKSAWTIARLKTHLIQDPSYRTNKKNRNTNNKQPPRCLLMIAFSGWSNPSGCEKKKPQNKANQFFVQWKSRLSNVLLVSIANCRKQHQWENHILCRSNDVSIFFPGMTCWPWLTSISHSASSVMGDSSLWHRWSVPHRWKSPSWIQGRTRPRWSWIAVLNRRWSVVRNLVNFRYAQAKPRSIDSIN